MRIRSSAATTWLWALGAAAACNAQGPGHPEPNDGTWGSGATGASGGSIDTGFGGKAVSGGGGGGKGGTISGKGGSGFLDDREVFTPDHVPPPISGGTLLALRAGGRAVVADSDRDRIVFVDTVNHWVEATVTLGDGAEPGRLVEGEGEVHALLRGTGEVVTLDLATHTVVSRRSVCKAPRGLAFNEEQGTLLVACLEGRLVELPASEGEALRTVASEVDLRDVVFAGDRLLATRFRSAELLELDMDLATVSRSALGSNGSFTPSVAWRAVAGPNGSIVVAHQRGTTETVQIGDDVDPAAAGAPGEPGVGGGESGYGGDVCSGIVESAVTTFAADGTMTTSGRLAGSVLPVDVAVSPDGLIAIASAGVSDELVFNESISLAVFSASLHEQTEGGCTFPSEYSEMGIPTVGVAFDPKSGELLTQTREPATLRIYDLETLEIVDISLGGLSALATGHETFHRDAGGGIACASCHPEGTDDGRVWEFSTVGARRTQPLDVALEGSAPFHWSGEFESLDTLMGDVFVTRMNGPLQSPARVAALESYLFGFTPRPGVRAPTEAAALRGKDLFESESVGCTECHEGAAFRKNETVDIGKGEPMQIPSLLGIATRPPYMHDGCAATLRDRFGADCGGSRHGKLTELGDGAIDDLVAYLETL